MDTRDVGKLNALFNTGQQSTRITIARDEEGRYGATALFQQSGLEGFPAREVIKREGVVDCKDVRALARDLQRRCEDWYHHYLPPRQPQSERRDAPKSWWGLRIQYDDGTIMRWEGVETAPWNLDDVYNDLKTFGMPSLNLDWPGSLVQQFHSRSMCQGFDMVEYYQRMIRESYRREEGPGKATALFARELLDDLEEILLWDGINLSPRIAFRTWGIEPTLESLRTADVSEASPAQMASLYEAMTNTDNPVATVIALMECGVLDTWSRRLEELPDRDAEGFWDRDDEVCEIERKAVDVELRKLIEEKAVFTAHDVAERVGCTGQRTSARIRSFVSRGELKVVGDGVPRRYQAA